MQPVKHLFYLGFLSLFGLQCVETIVTIRVLPDGNYTMRFHSRGDSTDVFDDDFPHPVDDNWSRAFHKNEGEDNETWTLTTHGLFSGKMSFPEKPDSVVHFIHNLDVTKTDGWIATHYKVDYRFRGREAFKKYPEFAQQILGVSSDSTLWISEVLTYIVSKGMNDLQAAGEHTIDPDLAERIKNHMKGYFSHIKEKELFDELNQDFLRKALSPFLKKVPSGYIEKLANTMSPYEEELRITSGLADDKIHLALFLPGAITSHNADNISDDTLKWEFGLEDFINDDYKIRAASIVYSPRQIQAVILGVTGLFLLVLWILFKSRNKK